MTYLTNPYNRSRGGRFRLGARGTQDATKQPTTRDHGLALIHGRAGSDGAETDARGAPAIRSLGIFAVLRDDAPIPSSEWLSKKSRDLLRLLVARRGRAIHRETAIETLWPGVGSPEGDNRLAVAISRARSVLDPKKDLPQDAYIATHEDVIWLRTDEIDVDVERFLRLGAAGLRATRDGRDYDGRFALGEAFSLYRGDFLESQVYEEWTMPLREEARATFISVALALAAFAADDGEYESAVYHYSAVLEKDPFAEEALLGLVRAAAVVGRHGEAQRHYMNYVNRMTELAIEPAPCPRIERAI